MEIRTKSVQGFTLLEILLVVAAIGILASIVIIAINPTKQLGDTRNAQRRSDVNTLLNAVYQYSIDNQGSLPAGITGAASGTTEICATGVATSTCVSAGLFDLSVLVPKYVVAMPVDPTGATTTNGTGYRLSVGGDNRITVFALGAEQNATISVTR